MRATFTCLLTGLLLSVVGFSQTDTSVNKNYLSIIPHKHFNNPFYKLSKDKPAPAASFSFLRGSELHVSSRSTYRFVPYSSYTQNPALWKDIISLAGEIAIQAYQDSYILPRLYPNR
jgi:hypothetical protein